MIKNGTNCLHVKIKKGEVKVFLKANSASQEYPFFHLLKIIVLVAYLQNFENVLFPKYMQLKFFSKEEFSSKVEIPC